MSKLMSKDGNQEDQEKDKNDKDKTKNESPSTKLPSIYKQWKIQPKINIFNSKGIQIGVKPKLITSKDILPKIDKTEPSINKNDQSLLIDKSIVASDNNNKNEPVIL